MKSIKTMMYTLGLLFSLNSFGVPLWELPSDISDFESEFLNPNHIEDKILGASSGGGKRGEWFRCRYAYRDLGDVIKTQFEFEIVAYDKNEAYFGIDVNSVIISSGKSSMRFNEVSVDTQLKRINIGISGQSPTIFLQVITKPDSFGMFHASFNMKKMPFINGYNKNIICQGEDSLQSFFN